MSPHLLVAEDLGQHLAHGGGRGGAGIHGRAREGGRVGRRQEKTPPLSLEVTALEARSSQVLEAPEPPPQGWGRERAGSTTSLPSRGQKGAAAGPRGRPGRGPHGRGETDAAQRRQPGNRRRGGVACREGVASEGRGGKNRAEFHPNELYLKSVTRKDKGQYTCQAVGDSGLKENTINLVVQVPPSKPKAQVPSSVTIGNRAILSCLETDGSPQPTFKWYKNDILMPVDPKTNTLFKNSSYTLDTTTGVLTFEPATSFDAGDYACEADNGIGASQKSEAVHLEPSEVNVGGIVAAVVLLLIVFGLAAFGVWFAYSRGFFSKRRDTSSKKVIYSQPSTRSDGEFKQTSSFLV